MREGRHSTTAAKIARGMLYLEVHPVAGKVLPDGFARATQAILGAAGLLQPWHLRVYRSRSFDVMASAADVAAPGLMLHFALRKRAVEDEAREALAAGARQVLVLGAGFDVLCVRLAGEHPDVLFVEIDHPATSVRKQAGVRGAGMERPNLRLVAADLGEKPLSDVLAGLSEWDRTAPTYVVAEGLLMYLPAEAVAGLLDAVHAATGPGSRFFLTWVPGDAEGRAGGDLPWYMRASLRSVGEALKWGPRPGELPRFVRDHGWALREDSIDLRARYLAPIGFGGVHTSDIEAVGVAWRAV